MTAVGAGAQVDDHEEELSLFRAVNARGLAKNWDERLELIKRVFPSIEMDWNRAFRRDIELAGRILKDILKADQAPLGRPGPRPALDVDRAELTYERWSGEDPSRRPYSILPFHEAFALLTERHSIRQISDKTGISSSHIHRLLHNELVPTGQQMEAIAKAYKKRPSYFVEYRIGAVAAAIVHKLVNRPDKSISAYEAIMHQDPELA